MQYGRELPYTVLTSQGLGDVVDVLEWAPAIEPAARPFLSGAYSPQCL